MDTKKELEKLKKIIDIWKCELGGIEFDAGGYKSKAYHIGDIETQRLAKYILSKLPELGFVKLEDMEINKEKLKFVPAVSRILLDFEKTNTIKKAREMFDILINQISRAKGILRTKETKK